MGELSIYDPPATIKEAPAPPQPSKYSELMSTIGAYKCSVSDSFSNVTSTCRNATDIVASVVEPITKRVPVTSDNTKKVGVIGICALSGLLQGRRKGRLYKYLYPLIATGGGCSTCYPKQTYNTSSRVVSSALPIIALSGKATVEFGKSTVSSLSALFPSTPIREAVTSELSPEQEPADIAEECPIDLPEELPQLDYSQDIIIPEVPDLDIPLDLSMMSQEESEDVIELISEIIEDSETIEEDKLPVVGEDVKLREKLEVPESEVEGIEEDLGLGDKEHDDMYSTRSSRSLYIVRT